MLNAEQLTNLASKLGFSAYQEIASRKFRVAADITDESILSSTDFQTLMNEGMTFNETMDTLAQVDLELELATS